MGKSQNRQYKCEVLERNLKEVIKLYTEEHWSASKIANRYGIFNKNGNPNRNVVLGFFHRNGIFKGQREARPVSKEQELDMKELYEKKAGSIDHIARMYGIARQRVVTILENQNVKLIKKPKNKMATRRKIIHQDVCDKIKKRDALKENQLPSGLILDNKPLPKQKVDSKDFYEASLPKNGYCKYPVGDSVPHRWCNKKAENGSSYCKECSKLCYRKGSHMPVVHFRDMGMRNKFVDRDV